MSLNNSVLKANVFVATKKSNFTKVDIRLLQVAPN